MKVYRLHKQLNLWDGPFGRFDERLDPYEDLRDHRSPENQGINHPVWRERQESWKCYHAWSTIHQMWYFLRNPEQDWPLWFEAMYVSILEVKDCYVLPDGQVIFLKEDSSVITTIRSHTALRALAQES